MLQTVILPPVSESPPSSHDMNPVVQALLYCLIGAVVVFTALSVRATFRPRGEMHPHHVSPFA